MLSTKETTTYAQNMERMIFEPNKEMENVSMVKPGTSKVVRYRITTLMNQPAIPKVMIFMGRNRILMNGFKNTLISARASAAMNKVLKF